MRRSPQGGRRSVDRGTGRQGIELRNQSSGAPTPFGEAEGNIRSDDKGEPRMSPAQSETPGMPGDSMRENRETPRASGSSTPDRLEKAASYKTSMHAGGESDEQVVPAKRANKEEQSSAEGVEGSCSTKGNTEESHTHRTQGRGRVSQGLGGVRCPQGPEAEVHRIAASRDDRPAAGQLLLAEEASCAGSGRSDIAVWGGSGGAVAGPPRPNPWGRVSCPTVEENVHSQSRWPTTSVRDRRAGGQDRSTGRGDGSQRDRRRGLSGILLRVPAGAQPT